MSRKYKIRGQDQLYFVTFTIIDWIDVFIRDEYRHVFTHSHPIELSGNTIQQKLEYIHLNPVAAGFVDVPEAWIYSSARDYCGLPKV